MAGNSRAGLQISPAFPDNLFEGFWCLVPQHGYRSVSAFRRFTELVLILCWQHKSPDGAPKST